MFIIRSPFILWLRLLCEHCPFAGQGFACVVSSFHICYKYRTVNHAIVVVSIEDEYEGGFVSEKTEREAELKGGKAYQSLGLIRRTFSPFVPTNIKKL